MTRQKQKRIKINDLVKKKGTFLFNIHAAEKSQHAAGDWAGHEDLLIMTKDFSHDRFFFFPLLPPLDCLLTTEGDFSSSAAAMEPMDTRCFVCFYEHVNSAAVENCVGSDDVLMPWL